MENLEKWKRMPKKEYVNFLIRKNLEKTIKLNVSEKNVKMMENWSNRQK